MFGSLEQTFVNMLKTSELLISTAKPIPSLKQIGRAYRILIAEYHSNEMTKVRLNILFLLASK